MKKLYILTIILLTLQSCKTSQNTGIKNTNIEESMVKAMLWQEQNHKYGKGPTDWTNGAYYTGVLKAHETTKDKRFSDALIGIGKSNNWQPHNRYFHADDIAICNGYLYLKSIGAENVNLAPTDSMITDHLEKPHPWREGIADKDQRILWWWCDALFMAPPVLARYAKMKNDEKYLNEMHKYYVQTYDLLYNKEEKLFARDVRFLWLGKATDMKEPNGNKIFWSRGNGWVLAGLALTLEQMPKNYKHRAFYENLFKEMAFRIKGLQQEDGLWRTSLLSPESFNHGEVSGSGFHTFALTWGINNGLLKKSIYKPAVVKAWNALAECQQESGKIGWVQAIGAEPKPADKNSWFNFGTGAFLLAGSEILKLK